MMMIATDEPLRNGDIGLNAPLLQYPLRKYTGRDT